MVAEWLVIGALGLAVAYRCGVAVGYRLGRRHQLAEDLAACRTFCSRLPYLADEQEGE